MIKLQLSFKLQFSVHVQQIFGSAKCSYWDQSLDFGYGGWSSDGCQLVQETTDEATCHCTHLTNFAILVDTESVQSTEKSIGHVTIIGPVVLLVCVLLELIAAFISQ